MTETPQADMAEATRLTRAGRLTEATALIQRFLGGGARAPTAEVPPQSGLVHKLLDRLKDLGAGLGLGGHARPEPKADAAGGSFVAASFTNSAGTRAYKLFIPSAAGDRPLPLLVMLHGCTQSPDDFAAGTRMNLLAEAQGCYVAYPQQSAKANVQRCWNWFLPDDQARDRGEPSLIAGITREIMAQHRIDPARVYVAGMSAGGAQAAVMAATYPDLFAAVGIHSGLACGVARDLPSAMAAMRAGPNGSTPAAAGPSIPTILFHGDQDHTVNPANGDRIVAQVLGGAAPGAGDRAGAQRRRPRLQLRPLCRRTRPSAARALDHPRCRSRLVRRQPGRQLHRSSRPGRLARDAAVLPGSSRAARRVTGHRRRGEASPRRRGRNHDLALQLRLDGRLVDDGPHALDFACSESIKYILGE